MMKCLFCLVSESILKPAIPLHVKLRSHRANGRVTDKKLFYPFVSVRFRYLFVSHPVTPFLVR